MKYYLAPLEGITTYIYRRAYHTHYRPMEKYFTPFLVPHTKKDFNTREKNDILPNTIRTCIWCRRSWQMMQKVFWIQ